MRFQLTTALVALASATTVLASPSFGTPRDWSSSAMSKRDQTSPRPSLDYSPKTPTISPPVFAARKKICYVHCHNDGKTDDSKNFLHAITKCNDGGHIVFKKGLKYLIGTALDLTNLKHVDIDIQGTILFTNDTDYWQANSFKFGFQNVTSFFKLGGDDVFIYGGGTVDGNGQAWYDLYAANIYTLRPVLFGIDGLKNSAMSDVVLRYSPEYYYFVANSTNVVFDNINIAGMF